MCLTSQMQDELGPGAEWWTMDKFTIGLLENLARLGGLVFAPRLGGGDIVENKSQARFSVASRRNL